MKPLHFLLGWLVYRLHDNIDTLTSTGSDGGSELLWQEIWQRYAQILFKLVAQILFLAWPRTKSTVYSSRCGDAPLLARRTALFQRIELVPLREWLSMVNLCGLVKV
jgi:hypothetical protein